MEEEKKVLTQVDSADYDAADKPFDFVFAEGETALVCESDPLFRGKISAALKAEGYLITEAESIKDTLKRMRFHTYDVIVVNESFDSSTPGDNDVLRYSGKPGHGDTPADFCGSDHGQVPDDGQYGRL